MVPIDDTTAVSYRIQTQLDTPKEWILGNKIFKIKSWEIEKDEIDRLCATIIKGGYSINQIKDKERTVKGITFVYIENEDDIETFRTSLLITDTGTELRKISQLLKPTIASRTIKTTSPLWVSFKNIINVFGKYNSDSRKYKIMIDESEKEITYPIVRFYPTKVIRNEVNTKVNIVYIEFSPSKKSINDSFMALSMEHRTIFTNKISKEEAVLIFDRWTIEKKENITQKFFSKQKL